MNKNRILFIPAVIFLFSFIVIFLACENHEEDHNHGKEINKHEEHDDHEGHEHGHSDKKEDQNKVSSEKAVIKASETKGIQLLPEAIKTIGLKKLPLKKFKITGSSNYRLPFHFLVRHEMNRSCYLKRGPWFIQTEVRVIKKSEGRIIVKIHGSKRHDEIITGGVPLLHLAWLEAFGASGHGHGH